jgi:glutamine synthetase
MLRASRQGECINTGSTNYSILSIGDNVIAEYVWIDGTLDLRSKCKVIPNKKEIKDLSELPEWNFDGSSTNQAPGEDSEILLIPVALFPNPFLRYPNVLVLCECYEGNNPSKPSLTNFRCSAVKIFNHEKAKKQKPWFGIEQE